MKRFKQAACLHVENRMQLVKWIGVRYVLPRNSTNKWRAGPERTASPTGMCNIMTREERPVRI